MPRRRNPGLAPHYVPRPHVPSGTAHPEWLHGEYSIPGEVFSRAAPGRDYLLLQGPKGERVYFDGAKGGRTKDANRPSTVMNQFTSQDHIERLHFGSTGF